MTITKVRRSAPARSAASRGRCSGMNASASGKRSRVRKRSRSSITVGRQPRAAAKRTTGMASSPAAQISSLGERSSTSTKPVIAPPHPDRLVVGGEVEVDETGLAVAHDLPGELLHVTVQAAAADIADELPAVADEETGAGPAVRGAPHRHDGGEGHLLPTLREGLDGFENVGDLAAHRGILKP